MKQSEMFDKPKRKKPRVMMHMIDVGTSDFQNGGMCALFKCKKCGDESGWLHGFQTKTEVLRGVPCDRCNDEK